MAYWTREMDTVIAERVEAKALSTAAVDEVGGQDFTFFCEVGLSHLNPDAEYLPNWHIRMICERFEQIYDGRITRSLICLPPRHLKSVIGSVLFPAWALGRNPALKIVCISYAADLAEEFAHATRKLMQTDWYKRVFPKTRLDPAERGKQKLSTTKGGFRRCSSIQGGTTGKGGDILILDDLIKASDVRSDVIREKVNDWFSATLRSRLDDPKKGRIVVIAQRLHVDDLPGRLLQAGGWDELILPLVNHEDRILRICGHDFLWEAGEYLHEARIGTKEAEALKRDMGTALFEAQYNQRPVPAGGHIFKLEWLNYTQTAVDRRAFEYVIQSWDTAYITDEKNDYSVCATLGVRGSEIHILDIYRAKIEIPQQIKMAIELQERWQADLVLFEATGSGHGVIQPLRQAGYPWVAWASATKPKVERAEAQTWKFERRRIWLPRDAIWRSAFETELSAFPHAKHDDQVDAVVQFLTAVDSGRIGQRVYAARNRR
ncbi:MAG: phage terminase large subunit [Rhizorhabdus sp.]|uniref:phage terminase large subunit n=1 Tax=Rhizorhabdus sp. TaxID=1968843 RepID=UPI001B42373A|nr:phage terminase large subunit [Rhizorhabdus sp.]MBP8233872.1 phage terminase large subunit [Rhizorhabdus sp.]